MNTTATKLVPEGLFVLWNWEWIEPGNDSPALSASPSTSGNSDEELSSEGDKTSTAADDETSDLEPVQKHTVTFKCIGASRYPECREVLALAAKRMREGQTIDVMPCPEPHNKYDAKAIVFVIKENDKWKCVGYVVREALDSIHEAMKKRRDIESGSQMYQVLASLEQIRTGMVCCN